MRNNPPKYLFHKFGIFILGFLQSEALLNYSDEISILVGVKMSLSPLANSCEDVGELSRGHRVRPAPCAPVAQAWPSIALVEDLIHESHPCPANFL